MVLCLDRFLLLLVLGGKLLRILDGAVDVFLGHVGGRSDRDVLFLARALIGCGDVHDTVGVDVKRDLDLRDAAGCGRDAVQNESAQRRVAGRHIALTLEHMDLNRGLVVGRGGVNLALLDRDGGVAVDDAVEDAAHRLDTERQRRYIEQDDVLDVAAEDAALDRRADCDALIRVDALEGLLAHEALDRFLHGRDTSRAADEQHLCDIAGLQICIRQCLLDGPHRCGNEVCGQLIELCAGQRCVEVLRAGCIRRDERQIDVGGSDAGELNLRLLGRLLQSLHRHLVGAQVNAALALEGVGNPVHDACIEVIAAETVVARGGQHLEDAVRDLEDRDIERTAAEVKDHDLLLGFLIHAVCQCGRGRLVDDTLDVQARDLARVLGCLALCVREVRGDGDDRLCDLRAEISLGVRLQLLQDHRRDFLWRVLLAVDLYLVGRAHFTLDAADRAVGVGDGLTLCHLTDHALAGLAECNDRRCGSRTLGVRNDDRLAAFVNRNARVSRTKIYTNYFSHDEFLRKLKIFNVSLLFIRETF